MCMAVHKTCECGANHIQFHMRDNVLPPEVVTRLFCPSCPGESAYDPKSMVADNGWYIEYDMEVAKAFITRRNLVNPDTVQPEYIFDQGYAAWLEMYPGEKQEIKAERDQIMQLLEVDQQKYLREIQKWNVERIDRLKEAGWRKARMA